VVGISDDNNKTDGVCVFTVFGSQYTDCVTNRSPHQSWKCGSPGRVVEGSASCEVVLQHQYVIIKKTCVQCQDRRTGICLRKVRAFVYDASRQAGDSRAGGTYFAWPMMGRENPTPTGRNARVFGENNRASLACKNEANIHTYEAGRLPASNKILHRYVTHTPMISLRPLLSGKAGSYHHETPL
jgi:hypothetical protein